MASRKHYEANSEFVEFKCVQLIQFITYEFSWTPLWFPSIKIMLLGKLTILCSLSVYIYEIYTHESGLYPLLQPIFYNWLNL